MGSGLPWETWTQDLQRENSWSAGGRRSRRNQGDSGKLPKWRSTRKMTKCLHCRGGNSPFFSHMAVWMCLILGGRTAWSPVTNGACLGLTPWNRMITKMRTRVTGKNLAVNTGPRNLKHPPQRKLIFFLIKEQKCHNFVILLNYFLRTDSKYKTPSSQKPSWHSSVSGLHPHISQGQWASLLERESCETSADWLSHHHSPTVFFFSCLYNDWFNF